MADRGGWKHAGTMQWWLVVTLAFWICVPLVQAGVVITRQDGSREWYGDGVVKTAAASGTVSVVSRDQVLMVFPMTKKYWKGSIVEYCRELERMGGDDDGSVSYPAGPYTIRKVGIESVADRPAVHYRILYDGAPILDLWVNEEPEVGRAIQKMEQSGTFLDCGGDESGLLVVDGQDFYPAVEELSGRGLIVRRQSPSGWSDSDEAQDNVVRIEVRKISPDEVSLIPPEGMTRARSIRALFGM